MYIQKRDGRKVKFDHMKIVEAILSAFRSVDGKLDDYALVKAGNIADYIAEQAELSDHVFTIDEIQNFVEKGLMSTKRKDVAKAYIEYRYDRDKTRKWNNHMMNVVKEKLSASNVQNQNANVDEHSFGGRKGEADSVLMKEFALDNCMSKKSRDRHLNNEIYIHDLDSYGVGMHNCLSIPFDDLLANGFNTRQSDVRPANSVNTAFQLLAVIFQLQSLQQFGGVAATHLDWTMVPYVRKSFWKHFQDGLKYIENQEWEWNKDFNHIKPEFYSIALPENGMDIGDTKNQKCGLLDEHLKSYRYAIDQVKKELDQAVEGMYHNLNTLQSRSGN